ncbi:HdeA/HdeB family chaperone [Mesorhizobium sp. ANAO-SY3R2]|uniref:HdeA/HdeB family chaperone n=1 Tax=Mesorhizobium sp. ANAO-SY3R2 TaxID=3166644 RepID=UPI00366F7F44
MLMKITGASIVSTLLVLSAAHFALAEAAKPTSKEDLKKKAVAEITCEDFNGVEETFKPAVIAWAAGYKQGEKKPDDVAVDIAGIEKITPFIVEACQKEPKASFWKKAEDEIKKVF